MKELWKLRKILFSLLSLRLLASAEEFDIASTADGNGEIASIGFGLFSSRNREQNYTINFTNVPIKEYLKFISKISGMNFAYDEGDLAFTVTIVSEEPWTLRNVLAALVQTLRIHGLNLIEQENSLLITRSTSVNEFPTIDLGEKKGKTAPIITKLFQIKNANLNSVLTVVKSMVSQASILEAVPESRQLLITDVSTNVEKITQLIKQLDSAELPLEIEIYKTKHMPVSTLIDLAKQITAPFAEGHTLLFVPREDQGTIFIVSTPVLLERVIEVLEDLDTKSKKCFFGSSPHSGNYWLYNPVYLSGKELERALEDIYKNLNSSGFSDQAFLHTLSSMKWSSATNAILFTGDSQSLTRIESLVKLIDVPTGSGMTKILFYQPKYLSNEQIEEALDELADKLDTKNSADRDLATAIDHMTWVPDTYSFLFKSTPATIEKIHGFLTDLDNPKESEAIVQTYFLYNLKYARGEDVMAHLKSIAHNLPSKDPSQKAIASTIKQVSLLKQTNSLLITGTQKAVEDVKTLIGQFDHPNATPPFLEKTSFFLYKPLHLTPNQLKSVLQQTARDLKEAGLADPILLDSIETMRIVEATHTVIFTGSNESLEKTKEILSLVDIPSANYTHIETDKKGLGNYAVYKPQHIPGRELINMMHEFKQTLSSSSVRDTGLFKSIDNLKYIEKTKSILISGDSSSVEKVEELLKTFDMPGYGTALLSELETSFLVYKLQYHPGSDLQTTLKQIGHDLMASDPGVNKNLIHAINSIQWVKMTNSLLATGTPDTLTRLRELIESVDVPLRQVFIEVLIVQTTLTNSQTFGLQWGNKLQYLNRFATGMGNFPPTDTIVPGNIPAMISPLNAISATATPTAGQVPPNLTAQSPQSTTSLSNSGSVTTTNTTTTSGSTFTGTFAGFDLGVIGDLILHKGKSFLSLTSLLQAIQLDTDSIVVMNPKIIGQDSQASTMFVGQNVPYVGSTIVTTTSPGTQTASNLEYRDVGINLSITPTLGADDIITLDIFNDITSLVPTTAITGLPAQTAIQTNHTNLSARIHVPNNHFVALSGMLQDTKGHTKTGIPCLGGLPVIGALFSNNSRTDTKNNIIFFIRPIIIDSVEDFKEITRNQENLLKEQAVKEVMQDEINDGLNWVKPCYEESEYGEDDEEEEESE